jgi:hypothetical protein
MMTQVIVDDALRSKLLNFSQPLQFCDDSGRVLGRFVPEPDLSEWETASPDISEEELQRRLNSNEKRYSTAEVLAHLEQL